MQWRRGCAALGCSSLSRPGPFQACLARERVKLLRRDWTLETPSRPSLLFLKFYHRESRRELPEPAPRLPGGPAGCSLMRERSEPPRPAHPRPAPAAARLPPRLLGRPLAGALSAFPLQNPKHFRDPCPTRALLGARNTVVTGPANPPLQLLIKR